jgi:hypothetical protein
MRTEKTYTGSLMTIGKNNEQIIYNWFQENYKDVIDFREFRLAQRIDVDFGIETIDGNILLLELKSDKWISERGNLCFEVHRINHYVENKWFYLGWGWRSPAQKIMIRNPNNGETFIFDFLNLRKEIAIIVGKLGKNLRTAIVETDDQKTTFNFLIPMDQLKNIYKKVIIL